MDCLSAKMGVLLSEDEVLFISHLLISLKADDLVLKRLAATL